MKSILPPIVINVWFHSFSPWHLISHTVRVWLMYDISIPTTPTLIFFLLLSVCTLRNTSSRIVVYFGVIIIDLQKESWFSLSHCLLGGGGGLPLKVLCDPHARLRPKPGCYSDTNKLFFRHFCWNVGFVSRGWDKACLSVGIKKTLWSLCFISDEDRWIL